uniref:putative oxidoreductase YteT isoform X1 n=1 Tax=Styela clava TaxID=7725 RepID=UPI00193A18F4|nr:putative oxidoreductase YteT isoform X1 [Styela clava]
MGNSPSKLSPPYVLNCEKYTIYKEEHQPEELKAGIRLRFSENVKNTRLLRCIILGGGNRGQNYASYALDFPQLVKIVAIADPRLHVRKQFERLYHIPERMQFKDWLEIAALDKIADFVCICTPNTSHKQACVAFARKKYHILLEKPMATTKQDCIEIVKECKENKVMLTVCHVLRYYPPNKKIKELIDSGIIGDVVNIQHLEPIGFCHFAHNYVRGKFGNAIASCSSLLAKSCHDIDLILFWMGGQKGIDDRTSCVCTRVSSFGSLIHFKKENKPEGAGDRCYECSVVNSCPYSASRMYLDRAKSGHWGWPVSFVTDVEDIAVLTDRLQNGPYGRCVYACDNDVCDNQVVNFQFSGGQIATFSMVAFAKNDRDRKTRIFGTRGEISYVGGSHVKHYDFLTRNTKEYHCTAGLGDMTRMKGHSGADFHLMDSFVKAVMYNDPSYIQSGPDETLKSHMLVFAAEESRLKGKTLKVSSDLNWDS